MELYSEYIFKYPIIPIVEGSHFAPLHLNFHTLGFIILVLSIFHLWSSMIYFPISKYMNKVTDQYALKKISSSKRQIGKIRSVQER